jgi:hypothetical protein
MQARLAGEAPALQQQTPRSNAAVAGQARRLPSYYVIIYPMVLICRILVISTLADTHYDEEDLDYYE